MIRAVRTLLIALASIGSLVVIPAGAAQAAADCNFPVATFVADTSSGTTYWKGRGAFTCNNVHAVSTRVEIYYRQGSAHPYRLRTSTGWDGHANIGSSVTWVDDTVFTTANCGDWYVRAYVRFTRNGSTSSVTRDDMTIVEKPTCG